MTSSASRKVLVAGWFSFKQMGASAGDLMARDLACDWLRQAGRDYDVALAAPFVGGIDWSDADPQVYSEVIFVCGPFGNGPPVAEFLQHFSGRRLIGLNLTMLQPLADWNPFDKLWERDSSATARPDMAVGWARSLVPVVGLVLIDAQPEYGERDFRERANAALCDLASRGRVATVEIDTRLDTDATGLRTAAQVESLIARMDMVLTTRLHGTVLAIKNGVPALAVDSVAGGGKILRQAQALGWPCVLTVETLTEQRLLDAFNYCLSEAARTKARECAAIARQQVDRIRREFVAALASRS
jgi:hypothetical protein